MASDLRPKIYLMCCLLALLMETVFILGKAPATCLKCKTAFVPSREVPEMCQPCVEQLRAVLGAPVSVDYEPPYPVDPRDPVVVLETTRGRVEVELFTRQAPISTENFLRYVRGHHYDGVIFHRIEDYLCVTGRNRGGYGQPLTVIEQSPKIVCEDATGLLNRAGTLSLPHLDGVADTATSDFFFNLKDNPYYDSADRSHHYAVFGQVVKGFDVVHALRFLPVVSDPWPRFPREPIVIRRAYERAPVSTAGTISALDSQTGR